MTEQYTYQVARVRVRELSLLNKQDIDSLMACKSYEEGLTFIKDKGFGTSEEKDLEELLASETEKLWSFMKELLKDLSVFDVLLCKTDYNNIKAAIKSTVTGKTHDKIYKSGGTVNIETLVKAVTENEFSLLPKEMIEPAKKAYQTILKTRDGQLCDMILDKACLESILKAGDTAEDSLVKDYAELTVAIANIKIAVRCEKTSKSFAFIKDALVPCKTLDAQKLAVASAKNSEEIYSYLANTKYSASVEMLKESNSAFEKWCDDKVMELVKKQKTNPFTIGPLMAYVIARENEINAVKIILASKRGGLKDEIIRERLREMYV
ncbi:MAG: V-type ATPase subunit [Clostridia bacterium]